MAWIVFAPMACGGRRSSMRGSLLAYPTSASSDRPRPGAIAPPMYAPSALSRSKFVLVPTSITIAAAELGARRGRCRADRRPPPLAIDLDVQAARSGVDDHRLDNAVRTKRSKVLAGAGRPRRARPPPARPAGGRRVPAVAVMAAISSAHPVGRDTP
jgi:hypothetical protein